MASAEILAILTASAINQLACGGRSSSMDSLSSSEMAGLLSGLNDKQMIFALAKYMCDSDSVKKLLIYTKKQAQDAAKREKWKARPSQLDTLAELVVFEALKSQQTHEAMAKEMNISKQSFGECWKDKLALLMQDIFSMENTVRLRLRKNSSIDCPVKKEHNFP